MRFLILVVVVLLTGCYENPRADMNKKAYERCVETGGIPLLSQWSNSLEECQYPPKEATQ